MQVSTNTNAGYYSTATYQRSKTGNTSSEFATFTSYHYEWMSQSTERSVSHAESISTSDNTTTSPTGAVTIAESEDEGEFLGLTMIPEEGQSVTYGMRAMLSDKSTPDNPIVQVISNLGGQKVIYNVEVNKVDPQNATQLEMFALLNYTDKMGITDGGTFGSFHQMNVYADNASRLGYCNSISGGTVFLNKTFDWPDIMEQMMKQYFEAEIYKQYEDCSQLLDYFKTISAKGEKNAENVPEQFAGMSFQDLINSSEAKKNQIPTVNKIVSAKNPEDGQFYITYFTEDKITCHDATGKKAWELEIADKEQADTVRDFFENYAPEHSQTPEYYSDNAMGIAASKDFWIDQFHANVVEKNGDFFGDEKVTNVIEMGVVTLSSGVSIHFNYDTGEVSCTDDTPGRNYLWTLNLSAEEQERCMELFVRSPYEGHWEYRYAAYLEQKSFWESYLNGEITPETLNKADWTFKEEDFFEEILQNCPNSVKTAWETALTEVDEMGELFSMNKAGNIEYCSELYKQMLYNIITGTDTNIFGTTEESAVKFAESAMQNLGNTSSERYQSKTNYYREKERQLYQKFIQHLKSV